MQDEVNSKVVALSVRVGSTGAKMSAHLLRLAMKKFLEEGQRHRTVKKEPIHGKQTVRELMKQDTALTNIEITDQNIKSFERVARKYNIDFALKKDKSADPPFFPLSAACVELPMRPQVKLERKGSATGGGPWASGPLIHMACLCLQGLIKPDL